MAQDDALGPVLLSVKHELLAGQDYVRLILRLQTGTLHEVVPASCLSDQASPHRMAKVSLSIRSRCLTMATLRSRSPSLYLFMPLP